MCVSDMDDEVVWVAAIRTFQLDNTACMAGVIMAKGQKRANSGSRSSEPTHDFHLQGNVQSYSNLMNVSLVQVDCTLIRS